MAEEGPATRTLTPPTREPGRTRVLSSGPTKPTDLSAFSLPVTNEVTGRENVYVAAVAALRLLLTLAPGVLRSITRISSSSRGIHRCASSVSMPM